MIIIFSNGFIFACLTCKKVGRPSRHQLVACSQSDSLERLPRYSLRQIRPLTFPTYTICLTLPIKQCSAIIIIDPKYSSSWDGMGNFYFHKKNYDKEWIGREYYYSFPPTNRTWNFPFIRLKHSLALFSQNWLIKALNCNFCVRVFLDYRSYDWFCILIR